MSVDTEREDRVKASEATRKRRRKVFAETHKRITKGTSTKGAKPSESDG